MEQCQIVKVHVIEIPEGNGRKEQNDKNIWGEKMKQWPKLSNVMNNYKLTETAWWTPSRISHKAHQNNWKPIIREKKFLNQAEEKKDILHNIRKRSSFRRHPETVARHHRAPWAVQFPRDASRKVLPQLFLLLCCPGPWSGRTRPARCLGRRWPTAWGPLASGRGHGCGQQLGLGH